MKKRIILIFVIAFVLIGTVIMCLIAQNGKNEENKKEDMTIGTFPRHVEGEIIEVVDDYNVIIQIMEDTYTFKVGDKIKVEYEVAFYEFTTIKTELKKKDKIKVMFLEGESIKKEDGYYIHKENEVYLVPEDETMSGYILEIYDGKVLIEVDSGDENGQKVMVEYEGYYECVNYEAKLATQNPKSGDRVWVLYSDEDASEIEGQRNIECKMIVKIGEKENQKPTGSVMPKNIWGRVEEISGDGIVNVRVLKSETEAKENDIIQIKYDNAYLMEVNTSVDLANGNLVVATIYDDNELEKAGEIYKLNIESLWRCYEGCVAYGYIEKINDDDTIDVVVEYVNEYDVAEIHNMHEFDNKKVNVKYEVFETNWSSDGWVSGTGTPMEGLEVMVLFQKDAIIESESGVAIECERIFEIKPDEYLQTVS